MSSGRPIPATTTGPLAVKAGPHYDYVPVSGIATIPAGAAQATAEVAVTVNNDVLDEHNETFMVMLCEPSDIAFLDDPLGLGVIVDDDVVTVAVSDGTATEPAREGETAELSFTVALSAVTGREVRVGYYTDGVERYQPPDTAPQDVQDLTATAGEDYTAVPDEPLRTLIFEAESGELTQTVTVVVLHDVLDEGANDGASAETVALRLTAANADFLDRSGSCGSGLVANDCALGQIIDNDAPPAVTVTGPDQALVEGDTAVFTVRLVDPDNLSETMKSGVEASVDYRVVHADTPGAPAELTADGDDLAEPLSGTVEFAVGATEAQVEVGTVDDSIDEPDFETFQMVLVPASARNAEPAPAADSATAQIEDNDDDGLHLTLIDACVGSRQQVLPEAHACDAENAADGMTFTVALVDADGNRLDADSNSYVSDRAVTVTYRTAQKLPGVGAATGGAAGVDGVDYVTVDSGTFDIEAGENSSVFYVELVDDDFHEGHEAFQVTIANAADYDMLVDSGEGVIVEDEPLPLVVVDDAVALEGDDISVRGAAHRPGGPRQGPRRSAPGLQQPRHHGELSHIRRRRQPGPRGRPGPGLRAGAAVPAGQLQVPGAQRHSAAGEHRNHPRRSHRVPRELPAAPGCRRRRRLRQPGPRHSRGHHQRRRRALPHVDRRVCGLPPAGPARSARLRRRERRGRHDIHGGSGGRRRQPARRRQQQLRQRPCRHRDVQHRAEAPRRRRGDRRGCGRRRRRLRDRRLRHLRHRQRAKTATCSTSNWSTTTSMRATRRSRSQSPSSDHDMLVDSGEGVIVEDDPLPLVVVDDAVAVEGDDVVFAVRLIDPADRDKDPADQRPAYSSRDITVSYHTYGDADSTGLGAGPGVDYGDVPQSPPASFKFPALSATAPPVSIATIPDEVTESRESFQLRLAFGVDVDYASLDRGTAVGTITDSCTNLDDDQPDPLAELTTTGVTVDEDADPNNKYRVTVSSTLVFCDPVPITYSTGGGAGVADATSGVDFEEVAGAAGILRAGSKTVTLEGSILDDTLDEADEHFTVTVNWDTTEERMSPYRGVAAIASTVTIIDDDDPPVVAVAGPATVYEGAAAQYHIRLVSRDDQDGPAIASGKEVSVKYHTCCGTATPVDDYEPVPEDSAVTLEFTPDLVTEHTFEIAAHTDDIVEPGGEEFQLRLRDPDEADIGDANTVTTAILDKDSFVVSVSSPHALEGQTMRFHVSLNEDPADDVTVQYATEDLAGAVAATAGSDYTPVDSRDPNMAGYPLVFTPGGSLTQTVAVDVLADSDNSEGSEILRLRLLSAEGAELERGDNTYGTGTIHDPPACVDPDIAWHPAPTLSVDQSSLRITEGASAPSTVRLSSPFCERQDGGLTYAINHVSTDRNDFPDTQDMSVDRALEPGSTTGNYAFDTLDDEQDEGNENFRIRVNWSRRMCIRNEQYCSHPNQETNVTISDNDWDSSSLIVNALNAILGRGDIGRNQTTLPFDVRLVDSNGDWIEAPHEVRVNYTTRDLTAVGGALRCTPGADYISQSGQIVIPAGKVHSRVEIAVCPTRTRRTTEQFQLVLLSDPAPVGAVLGDRIGSLILTGWTAARLHNSNSITTESSRSVRIWVRLDRPRFSSGSVAWATEACTPEFGLCVPATAGEDYVSASGIFEFRGNRGRNRYIDIELMNDNVDEPTEAFSVRLNNRNGDIVVDPAGAVASAWIRDDDPTPTLDFETAGLSVREGTAFTFTVELDGTSDREVTVDWATDSGGFSTAKENVGYASKSGTLTFIPGQTTASFTVMTINDASPESDETFRVRLSNPRNALLARPETFATATINDDDS